MKSKLIILFLFVSSLGFAPNIHFCDSIEALDGDGDLKSPIQYRRITIPSELIGLYDNETTPLIYVLDKSKRIIAKKIRARQIPLFL